tara:strand:- start:194 stop:346 length:153 start_codon:yes stop_codon:yes gene_type:complete
VTACSQIHGDTDKKKIATVLQIIQELDRLSQISGEWDQIEFEKTGRIRII